MKSHEPLRPGELTFSLAAVGFGLIAFREAYGISGFSGLSTGGVLPMLAAAVMIVSSLFIAADALRRRSAASHSPSDVAAFLFPRRLVLVAALLIAYAAAIPWVGFVTASTVFLFVSVAVLWRRGVLWSVVVTVASMASIYVIFRVVFQVVLPAGTLWR